jgi:hypothetical protein
MADVFDDSVSVGYNNPVFLAKIATPIAGSAGSNLRDFFAGGHCNNSTCSRHVLGIRWGSGRWRTTEQRFRTDRSRG